MNEIQQPQSKIRDARLTGFLHIEFVLTGAVNTMLGSILPLLAARWFLSDAQAGLLFTAQFGGSVCGVLASSFFTVRRGHRFCLGLGLGAMAVGSAMLLAGGYRLGLFSALLLGIGLGLAIPTTNLLVSGMNPHRPAAALSLINFSWGVGAVGCPFLVAALLRLHHDALFCYGLAALLMVVLASMILLSRTGISFPISASSPNTAGVNTSIWRNHWIPILGALFFIYVGSEGGVSGWISTYAWRTTVGAGTAWVLMPSLFWMALLLGRALVPLFLRSMKPLTLAQWGLSLASAGIIVLFEARNLSMIAVGVGIAGFGFSSVFPIAIASLSGKFGARESQVAGVMFALAGCGGATLPWLAGYISTVFGSLRYGLLVPLCGCLAMLTLNAQISRPD
jgi:fucose permease